MKSEKVNMRGGGSVKGAEETRNFPHEKNEIALL